MAFVKRNPMSAVLLFLIAALLVSTIALPGVLGRKARFGSRANAEDVTRSAPAEPTSVILFSRFSALRAELAIGNSDLAAFGCTDDQARTILTAALSWLKNNSARVEAAEHTQRAALGAVRNTTRRIRIGPRSEALIAQYSIDQRQLDAAIMARRAISAEIISALESPLDSTQRRVWATARANREAPSDLKYSPGLTASQARGYRAALRGAARSGKDGEPAALSVLNGPQQLARAAALENTQKRLEAIKAVSDAVLPPPREVVEGAGSPD
jgi:hypothetical protein